MVMDVSPPYFFVLQWTSRYRGSIPPDAATDDFESLVEIDQPVRLFRVYRPPILTSQ